MKEHVHEIEVKYVVHQKKVNDIFDTLVNMGFRHKSTCELVDMWLSPKRKGESLRIRKQTQDKSVKYLLSRKKTTEKDGEVKNKCEAESKISASKYRTLSASAKRVSGQLLKVCKTRYTFEGRIGKRRYTVAVDEVVDLGHFSGFYFEVETLVPFKVVDRKAMPDVKRTALQILNDAYEGEKLRFQKQKLSYRKMARLHYARKRA